MTIVLVLAAIVGAGAAVWWGSDLLESASAEIAARHRLPAVIEGAVLVAVGSSMPEIATTVFAAAIHDDFDLGLSVVVGSAIFNVLVIPGAAVLASGTMRTRSVLLHRDTPFYLLAVAITLLVVALASIHHPVEVDAAGGADATGERIGTFTPLLAVVPLAAYVLYLVLPTPARASEEDGDATGASLRPAGVARPWWRLAGALGLILVGVEILLRAAIELGDRFETPSFLWGVTVVAAVTSVPDAFVSVRLARAGRGTVSLANVLGSNIVDLLVAVPLGVLVAGGAAVRYDVALPLVAFLAGATVLLFALLRRRLSLGRSGGIALLAVYAAFVAWMVIEVTADVGVLPD